MANMNKKTKGVTPVGKALFAHLKETEKFNKDGGSKDTGKYTVLLKLDPKDEKAFLGLIDAEWQKFKDSLGGKKLKYEYTNGTKEYQGELYFKFSMNKTINTKQGAIDRTVPIFDTTCREVSKDIGLIGNDSQLKIAYELVPFYMNDKSYGVSLRLTAVQLIKLIEYGNNTASSFGFGQEEGFKAEDVPETYEEEEEVIVADDDEGDF